MGYTPLFDTLLTGTLFGRWPHTGIWACLLSRANREGVIDEQPAAIAAAIGVPLDTLLQCIHDFMAPDPDSRTPDHDGRRIELLDPRRTWGWRVLNHSKYREKARKKAYDEERTASGEDAARKRRERGTEAEAETPPAGTTDIHSGRPSRGVPKRPAKSRGVPLSEADAEAEANKNPPVSPLPGGDPTRPDGKRQTGHRLPDDFALTAERRKVAEAERIDPDRTFAKFCDHWRAANGANSRKRCWDAAWRNWCRTEADRSSGGTRSKTAGKPFAELTETQRQQAVTEAWDRQKSRAAAVGFRMPLTGEPLDSYRLKVDEAISDAQLRNRTASVRSVGQLLKAGGA